MFFFVPFNQSRGVMIRIRILLLLASLSMPKLSYLDT